MDYDRLRELQEKFDENPRRYFAPLANEYRKGGQAKRAIEICRTHLAQMPGHMSGQIVYGQALFEAGEWEEAKTVFAKALSLDPENLIALRSLGDMSLQAGDTAEARTWYARLLDADPKDTGVIDLISEIDASSEVAASPAPEAAPSPAPEKTDVEIPSMSAESAPAESAPAESAPAESAPAESAPAQAPANMEAEPAGFERTALAETPSGAEGLHGTEPVPEPMGMEGLKGQPPVMALEGAASVRSDDDDMALEGAASVRPDEEDIPDTWTPPPEITVQKREESPKEERTSSPPPRAPEPFVNETMAQLYVQQGYLQLALNVYRQLSAARPNDQALKDRIAEIEAADSKEHPAETPVMRREERPVERPAEPAGIAARQPSVKEFFATLGRRRPPRASGNSAARPGNSEPADASPSLATPAPGASLDAVFAGANVSPSDARAASRLAGAFSGASGGARPTPPTPPMPTPRVNPRLPQVQESEEDVAKFRAWLDGLTRE